MLWLSWIPSAPLLARPSRKNSSLSVARELSSEDSPGHRQGAGPYAGRAGLGPGAVAVGTIFTPRGPCTGMGLDYSIGH